MKNCFHVHTWRCGHASYETEKDYIETALGCGAEEIVFTDHAPFPGDPFPYRMNMDQFPDYCRVLTALKKEYAGRIRVRIGLEIEYLPKFRTYYEELRDKTEFLLLGQHFSQLPGRDQTYTFQFEECSREAASLYCAESTFEAIQSGLFGAIAHPERIFSDRKGMALSEEQERAACEMAAEAAEFRIPIECNLANVETGIFRDEFWNAVIPEQPVIFGYDAHSTIEILRRDLLVKKMRVRLGRMDETREIV